MKTSNKSYADICISIEKMLTSNQQIPNKDLEALIMLSNSLRTFVLKTLKLQEENLLGMRRQLT